ncbi:class I SAM-dependent methyltransferase [Legionella bononiensis]|uniref:Class I SAM-dependent methyltransferase n=1 Tax=Legionella bononiensis TaxID=2793102 RepID=A0ABS1WDX2_9GAMM|nr:class I SAM-dependent methyltransferase [Legionella bononiensis]MBL7479567.1 class I SAM-dependent methyltransferase [Legionella bononiensis]MBL7527558.1 class I SAM-dependent methyltransferase [Legionella bononiensis]
MNQHKLNSYLNLCTQFYDLIRPEPPEDAYAFYREYVDNAGGVVMEPMCGSGRFLLPLLKENFEVIGFDASAHMLDALHAKAKLQHLKPEVWQGFVEDLNRTQKYNLIFIPSGSFGHIINFDSVKKSLKVFYDHLNNDGTLLFEVETSKIVPDQLGVWRGIVCHKPDGNFILVNRLTKYEDNVCYSIDRYELVDKGQIIQTEIEIFNVRVYDDPLVLTDMLKEVGFREVKMIKAFDRLSKPDESDSSLVYECRK